MQKMKNSEQMSINIGRDTWHYNLYYWWKSFSGFQKSEKFQENLCHYMRVVLIWAPLGWFTQGSVIHPNVRPWMVFSFWTAVVLTIYGAMYHPMVTMAFWIGYIGVFVIGGVIYGLAWSMDKSSPVLSVIFSPFTFVGGNIWKRIINPIYFGKSNAKSTLAWLVSFAVFGYWVYLNFGIQPILEFLFITGLLGSVIFVLVAASMIIDAIVKRSKQAIDAEKTPKGIGTVELFKHYWNAKRGSFFCPFIKLPGQWEDEQ